MGAVAQLRELAVEFDRPLDPKLTVVLLEDGPCAGHHSTVPGTGVECWERVGRGVNADAQLWASYVCDPLRAGTYLYSGTSVTTDDLHEMLRAHTEAGNTYGQSEGA